MDEVSAHSSMSDYSEANLGPIPWENINSSWEDIVMDFRIPMVFTEVTIS